METRHVPPSERDTLTLGVDLASQPKGTAACLVRWRSGGAEIVAFHRNVDDPQLLAFMADNAISRVGIDAPFGWPLDFVSAVSSYADEGVWPDADPSLLYLRETDRHVRAMTGQQPLSVTTDRIAYCAMRCARLLSQRPAEHGEIDRSGEGRFVEVYPAAAMRAWGFDARSYKGPKPEAAERRAALVTVVLRQASWLRATAEQVARMETDDHALDALVAALIARASELDLVRAIPGGQPA